MKTQASIKHLSIALAYLFFFYFWLFAFQSLSAQNILPLSKIQPGMKGYGLTVFQGTEPERFEVEVIDILHGFRPTHDLILIRTHHPILENATTVAGMSGSPIYIEGKLIGAYAYGWSFGKDPVAGVTPIEAMLTELKQTRSKAFQNLQVNNTQAHKASSLTVSNTLSFGGFSSTVSQTAENIFRNLGFSHFQTTSGYTKNSHTKDKAQQSTQTFKPGSAIAIQLMRGDLSVSSIGTVTHVEKDRLLAFGHPMMDVGKLELPTATAKILHVLASQDRSFKIGEVLKSQGSLIFDRPPAVVAHPTQEAHTIPLSIQIQSNGWSPQKTWNVEIAEHKLLTPALVLVALTGALHSVSSNVTFVRYQAQTNVQFKHREPFEVIDEGQMKMGTTEVSSLSSLRLFDAVSLAFDNPFDPLKIKSIQVKLNVRFEQDIHTITQIRTSQEEVSPDQWVNLHIQLRPFQQNEYSTLIPLYIQKKWAGQTIEISVRSGKDFPTSHPIPDNIDDVFNHLQNRQRYSATTLVVAMKPQDQNLRMKGVVLERIPASIVDILQPAQQTTPTAATETLVPLAFQNMDHLVEDSATLSLKVRPFVSNP